MDTSKRKNPVIPSVVEGVRITAVALGTFGYGEFDSITISDGIEHIGVDAFADAKRLEKQPNGVVYFGNVAYKFKGTMPELNYTLTFKNGDITYDSSFDLADVHKIVNAIANNNFESLKK